MQFNLADLFESVADAVPDRVALVSGERRLTYARLDDRASRLAHHLRAAGVGPGQHVGVYLHNDTEFVETMLGAFKIRAVPININYRYVAGELRALFRDADLVALVHGPEFAGRVAEVAADVPTLRHLLPVGPAYEAALAASPRGRGFPARSAGDFHVIYTGGTTGTPKGVVWRHEDLFFAGMSGGNPMGEPARRPEEVAERARTNGPLALFPVPPLMHGAAQLGTFIGFLQGAKVVLHHRFEPAAVWRLVERERVNSLSLVGDAMARPLAEALAAEPADTSSLLVVSSAGAVFSSTVREELLRLLPNIRVLDNFGATETGFQGTGTPGSSPDTNFAFAMNPHTVVLGERLAPVPPGSGVAGRLALSGHVPLGYYNDPAKTREVFVEIGGVRWVMPGDMAIPNADGTVTVLGRGALCINTGGEKVFPEEVEAALKSHPHVFDAVVTGVPDERWGERVAAIVAARPGCSPSLDDLRRHCEGRLAGYKLPRTLVTVPEVLRSPSGKPDYGWARRVAGGAIPAR